VTVRPPGPLMLRSLAAPQVASTRQPDVTAPARSALFRRLLRQRAIHSLIVTTEEAARLAAMASRVTVGWLRGGGWSHTEVKAVTTQL